jgi:hypothetical protein
MSDYDYDYEWRDDYYCEKCEMEFYETIDHLINDIKHLEAKVVYLRYSLSRYLPKYKGEMLRCDIFDDLSNIYCFDPAYQRYVSEYCDGHDPQEDKSYVALLKRLSTGAESANL